MIWGGSCEKVHKVRSRKVEKTAVKVMTCHMHVNACHKKCRNFVIPQYFSSGFLGWFLR